MLYLNPPFTCNYFVNECCFKSSSVVFDNTSNILFLLSHKMACIELAVSFKHDLYPKIQVAYDAKSSIELNI